MTRRIVDLTLTLYDGVRGLDTEPRTTFVEKQVNTTTLHLYSHAGTHMDAPLHFVDGGDTIDRVDLETCVGPAEVLDLTHKAPNSQITVEDLEPYASRVTPGCRLLLRTDWSLHAERDDYRDDMPRVSSELAWWLVKQKVALIGLETPSVASLRKGMGDELREVHRILFHAGVVVVEALTNLRELTKDTVELIALPLKIRDCDGSPIRALAIEQD